MPKGWLCVARPDFFLEVMSDAPVIRGLPASGFRQQPPVVEMHVIERTQLIFIGTFIKRAAAALKRMNRLPEKEATAGL